MTEEDKNQCCLADMKFKNSYRIQECRDRRSNIRKSFLLVLVLLFICCANAKESNSELTLGLLDMELNTIKSTSINSIHNQSSGDAVKRLWGLADTVTSVGRLFQYHISNDAFTGPVQQYEVVAAGSAKLSSWLYFNPTTSTLEGIPTDSDIGQHYISVKAVGPGGLSHANDVFSVDVMPASHQNFQALKLKPFQDGLPVCSPGEPITRMTVTVDADVNKMENKDRIILMKNFINYLQLSKDWVQLLPRKKESSLDLSAIFAAPGNSHRVKTSCSVFQWQIGCNGKIDDTQQDIFNHVEESSRNGNLSKVIDFSVIGWHVSTYSSSNSRRFKRHIPELYPTPVPPVIPIHRATINSAPWEEDDNYNTDEFGEIQPESRVIPTMSSPTFMDPTRYEGNQNWYHPDSDKNHNHNHHHRTKSRGRHHHPNHATASPVYYPHMITRDGFAFRGTPVPTPEIVSIRPTATIHEPSRTYFEETTTVIPPVGFAKSVEPSIAFLPVSPTRTEVLQSVTTEFFTRPSVHEPTATHATHDISKDKNRKPKIKHLVEKLAVTAGKVFDYVIPENCFHDEDGNTRNLTLFLLSPDNISLSKESWVQFDGKRQAVYGLPFKTHIGNWKFPLHAQDSGGATTVTYVDITVQQHSMDRKTNHELVLIYKADTYKLFNLVDQHILMVKKLRILFEEKGAIQDSIITVRNASTGNITWSNDTVVNMGCSESSLQQIFNTIAVDKSHIRDKFHEILRPEFQNPRLKMRWLGYCRESPTTIPMHVDSSNTPPQIRNQIDSINASVGTYLFFPIPSDTFFDNEQQEHQQLTLKLFNQTQKELSQDSWIRYDSSMNAIVGLPLESDVGVHQFQLFAYDREGLSAADTFVVDVKRAKDDRKPSIEFSIVLKNDFSDFSRNLDNKIKLLIKLSNIYGDKDPTFITVLGITRGSVIFRWTNNTLPSENCPKSEIDKLLKFLFDGNATVSQKLIFAFQPDFNISTIHLIPGLVCQKEITPTFVSMVPPVTTIETEHATSDEDVFISTILPAIVIAVMLLLAAIVACILYRKKRKGKMSMEDNGTFVNKGIPVIFADELEEKPDPAKAPMIMKEEKPPLPPPEYPRISSGGGGPSTPPSERKDYSGHHQRASPHHQSRHPHHGSSYSPSPMAEHTENSPLYQPPPPFTTYRDSRMNRPKNTPTYRMPPPYVPP